MKISPARIAAFDVLLRIERDAALSSVLLPQVEIALNEKDRGLCHELVLGVLRRKLYLDQLIENLSLGKRLDREVAIALRIGLFQLIFLDRVPAHAAIGDSVELVARARKTSAKGFVNAILRSFERERPVLPFSNEIERISIEESHPRWLVEKWVEQFGSETAAAISKANNKTPDVAFRLVGNVKELSKQLEEHGEVRRSEFVPNCYLASRSTAALRDLAADGQIYFQDEGSQLVAHSVIQIAGRRILDLCAAPGGKTTMISNHTRSIVVAGDISFRRLERLRDTCASQHANALIVQLDGNERLPFEPGSFDTVFIDAPCSGTGTIRHNPEIRYSVTENDVAELSAKQLRILKNASELVAPGGSLFYSTCSLEVDENETVANAFMAAMNRFDVQSPRVNERFLTSDGFARTFPHRDDMDGFFIAVFRRV